MAFGRQDSGPVRRSVRKHGTIARRLGIAILSGDYRPGDILAGEKPVSFPDGQVSIQRASWGASEPERTECSVNDAVETLVYAFLEETHGGWENNEGAYGEFTFNVAERTITLDYNERYEDSHYTQHRF